MTVRILSFFLTKDRVDTANYYSLVRQEGVEQDIVVVSAKPVGFNNNFVYAVNQEYDLAIRVGLSINKALDKFWNPKKYSYFFKMDGDAWLPKSYLKTQVSKGKPIIGPGPAMLIGAMFFEKYYGGRWSVSYFDDAYMKNLPFALGFTERVWENDGYAGAKWESNPMPQRDYVAGKETYKFGYPIWHLLLYSRSYFMSGFSFISLKRCVSFLAGYFSSMRSSKYWWAKFLERKITKHYLNKVKLLK